MNIITSDSFWYSVSRKHWPECLDHCCRHSASQWSHLRVSQEIVHCEKIVSSINLIQPDLHVAWDFNMKVLMHILYGLHLHATTLCSIFCMGLAKCFLPTSSWMCFGNLEHFIISSSHSLLQEFDLISLNVYRIFLYLEMAWLKYLVKLTAFWSYFK